MDDKERIEKRESIATRKHCPVGAWTAHFGAANIHIGRGNVCNIIASSSTCACLASAQGQEVDCLSDAWFLCLCARSLSASRRSAAQFLCGRPYATTWTSLLSRPHEFGGDLGCWSSARPEGLRGCHLAAYAWSKSRARHAPPCLSRSDAGEAHRRPQCRWWSRPICRCSADSL